MKELLTWRTYGIAITILTLLYYGTLACVALIGRRRPQATADPAKPIPRELYLDDVLDSLEEVIINAQRKRYHPDEILSALRQKVAELKTIYH